MEELEPNNMGLHACRNTARGAFFSDYKSAKLLILVSFEEFIDDMVLILVKDESSHDIRIVNMANWESCRGPIWEIISDA